MIYQLESATLKTAGKIDLAGEVGRSLGIAVLGVPGRVAYAFETSGTKKEKAVLFGLVNAAPTLFRWPDTAGEPTGANWIGPNLGLITAEKGVVYFSADGKFKPMVFAELPGKMLYAGNEDGQWFTSPDPIAPTKLLFQQLGGEELNEFLGKATEDAKEPPTARLSNAGLAK
jgi:hypothetical protein